MIKPMNIITGWKNLLFGLETDLAKERSKHCASCDYAKMGSWKAITNQDSITEIRGLKCTSCGCPLSAKLRTPNEKCPIELW